MKTRQLLLGGALALAAGLLFFDRPMAPTDTVVQARERVAPASAGQTPTPAVALLRERERANTRATPHTRDLFPPHSWTPPPPHTPTVEAPPTAPPLPFTYIGRQHSQGKWLVYLGRGDEVLLVENDTVVDGTYKVSGIESGALTFVYLPLQQTQTLKIE